MPKYVDHDQRRREVAEVASELIAGTGVDKVTIRDVARAAGYSTTIVTHYFADKRQLLLHVYKTAAERSIERIDSVRSRDSADLQGCLNAILPLDRRRRRDWQIWLAFWGVASADREFAREQRVRLEKARRVFDEVLEAMGGQDAAERRREASRIATIISGVAVHAVLEPKDWPAARQQAFIAAELCLRQPA